MKKKIIGIIAASMIFGSVVSAAGIWGTYKGNQVIRITSNGETLKTSDVPAISYNGRTMIPISMLGQIGLSYKWDQKNQTVDVVSNDYAYEALEVADNHDSILIANIYKQLEDLGEDILKTNQLLAFSFANKAFKQDESISVDKAITDSKNFHNLLSNSPNVNKYLSSSPEIGQLLSRYNEIIDNQEKTNILISTNVTPDSNIIKTFNNLIASFNESADYGAELANSKYLSYIQQSLKL